VRAGGEERVGEGGKGRESEGEGGGRRMERKCCLYISCVSEHTFVLIQLFVADCCLLVI
jgi:hypothetical protein